MENPVDITQIKSAIVTNVYHIPAAKKIPLHQHPKHDEIFYCIAGSGFGILPDRELPLHPGQTLVVRRARVKFRLLGNPDRPFFPLLREKLKWGER